MSDPTTVWRLPDTLGDAERLTVESILRHVGGKEIILRKYSIVPGLYMMVEVDDE